MYGEVLSVMVGVASFPALVWQPTHESLGTRPRSSALASYPGSFPHTEKEMRLGTRLPLHHLTGCGVNVLSTANRM